MNLMKTKILNKLALVFALSIVVFGSSYSSAALGACAVANGPVSVCMVGDSITELGVAWRSGMAYLQKDWHYKGAKWDESYWHSGIGGDTTEKVLARLDSIPLDCTFTILEIGGNDLQNGSTDKEIIANIKTILAHLSSKGSKVYLLNLIPCNCGWINNYRITTLNNKLAEQITDYPILDVWSAFINSGVPLANLFKEDGIHPNYWGYAIMAKNVASRVVP